MSSAIMPLRILFANSFFAPEIGGGAELTLQRLATGLVERGHKAAAFTTGLTECVEQVKGVEVYRYPIDNTFRKLSRDLPNKAKRVAWQWRDRHSQLMAARFDHVVREFRPDVVQFHNLAGLTRSVWEVARAHSIPSVQVLHDLNLICPSSSMFKGGKACVSQCGSCALFRRGFAKASSDIDMLVGVSQFVLERLVAAKYFNGAEHRVIYNALQLPSPSPLPISEEVRFGYIGALSPPKGVEWLIDQFEAGMGTLTIAGEGSDEYVNKLRARAAGKPITFTGHISPHDFFSMVHVGVVPSIWNDTLPGVAIEGGAYGRPVIASRRGGLPEIVIDGVTGLLVDPDKPSSLGGAMRALEKDRALLQAMAGRAPSAVAKFTNFERFLDEYCELHESLLSGRSAR